MQKKPFPLILWENTNEFREEYKSAKEKFLELSIELNKKGRKFEGKLTELKFDINGYPEVFIDYPDNYMMHKRDHRNRKNLEDSIKDAKSYGCFGWWGLDDLENFVKGDGNIFECAMHEMGFVKDINEKLSRINDHEDPYSKILGYFFLFPFFKNFFCNFLLYRN